MMPSNAFAIGSRPACAARHGRVGSVRTTAWLAVVAAAVLFPSCGDSLGHRSVAEMSGSLPIGESIRRIRVEIQNGTVGMDMHADRAVGFGGGVRRAADSAADLAILEQIPVQMVAAPDPADATTLVVRGPALSATMPRGIVGLELGLHVPADLPVEIRVEQSGHVTVVRRTAPLEVHTGRGDLRFERCEGAIKARTGRGNVIAFDHRGDIDIRAAVGDMQVFVREPGSRIRLDTGQGTIQCYVPPTTGCRVDARAQIGRCGTSFGFPTETVQKYGAAMVGARGDGRTEIVLRTGSGHLSLGARAFE